MRGLAAGLLILGLIRHQLWEILPADIQALAWNASGALTISVLLLFCIYSAVPRLRISGKKTKTLYLVLGWWLYEELAVMVCSGVRMIWTLQVRPGQAQCDAISRFPLSGISFAIVAALAIRIHRETRNHDQS